MSALITSCVRLHPRSLCAHMCVCALNPETRHVHTCRPKAHKQPDRRARHTQTLASHSRQACGARELNEQLTRTRAATAGSSPNKQSEKRRSRRFWDAMLRTRAIPFRQSSPDHTLTQPLPFLSSLSESLTATQSDAIACKPSDEPVEERWTASEESSRQHTHTGRLRA